MNNNTAPYLSSNILFTGNKFIVTDETVDSIFGPGTTGMMNYVVGTDTACTNVVHIHATILKRGKQGMDRLDTNIIAIPIFGFKDMYSSTIMPEKKQKHYVYIKPVVSTINTIYEMPDLEYLGWALSWACYLNKLHQSNSSSFVWPKSNKNIINKMLNIPTIWRDDPQYATGKFCAYLTRSEFVNQMRIMETTLVERSLFYMSEVSNIEINAIDYLIKRNNDKTKICDKNTLYKTYAVFMEKHTNLKSLKKRNNESSKKSILLF